VACRVWQRQRWGGFISDTLVGRGQHQLKAYISMDFQRLLGRPMSCFPSFPGTVELVAAGDSIEILFTPNAADCGFSGMMALYADSVTGTWWEHSLAGAFAMGRLRMVKRKHRGP
jgi:hypothetical protein